MTRENQQETQGGVCWFRKLSGPASDPIISVSTFNTCINIQCLQRVGPVQGLGRHQRKRQPLPLSAKSLLVGSCTRYKLLTSTVKNISDKVCLQREDLPRVLLYWDILGHHFPRVHAHQLLPSSLFKPKRTELTGFVWGCQDVPPQVWARHPWTVTSLLVHQEEMASGLGTSSSSLPAYKGTEINHTYLRVRPHPTKRQQLHNYLRKWLWQESFLPGQFIIEVKRNTNTFSDTAELRNLYRSYAFREQTFQRHVLAIWWLKSRKTWRTGKFQYPENIWEQRHHVT